MEKAKNESLVHGGDIYTDGLLKGRSLIDFSSNINPLGVPQSFKDNIGEAMDSVVRYPDIQYRELYKTIIDYIGETNLNKDNLILGNGAAEIIDLAISSLKSILIVVPSFVEYDIDAKRSGCKIEYSYLKEDMTYDYEDILSKLKSVEGLIIGNPNNPNGNIIDKEKFKPILEYCEEHNKLIIIDEAFIEFTGSREISFINEMQSYKCLFLIRALTKFFALPGIRFGYGISSNKEVIEKMKKRQNPWNINCFAETAAKYVLKDSKYIEQSLKWIKEEREYLPDNLKKLEFIEKVYTTYSNYVLCKLKKIDCNTLYDICLKENIVIRKADNFRGLDKQYVRFAIKDRERNVHLIQVLKKRGNNL
ncbi:pyridoxal phosphate-dependent aminotransferase [Clostridium ganghwense]|uniref:Histidinol-phosphate transaminase n=1 Tax=Clostridium ganghwense TaxID=312089 RepID=A0ABT4CSY1_9CLOT|nr:histidinol-phosphate transaminase [Clostridium ganghwense]MCY6372177.1 histidinol-phosphate transaminase [Clostridium ganghwense]